MKKNNLIFLVIFWSYSIIMYGQPTTPNWPVNSNHERGCIIGNIGEFRHGHYHAGADIISQNGTITVYAVEAGTYSFHPSTSCWNQYIQVGNVIYLHLQELNIPPVGHVAVGTPIGTMYGTGGCALHVHLQSDGVNYLNNELYQYTDNLAPIIVDHQLYKNRDDITPNQGNTYQHSNQIYDDIITMGTIQYTKVYGKVDIVVNAYDPGVGSTGGGVVVNGVVKDNRLAPTSLSYEVINSNNVSVETVENINFTTPIMRTDPESASRNYVYADGTLCPASPSVLKYNITSHLRTQPYDRYWNTRKRIGTADDWTLNANFDARCNDEAMFKDGKYQVEIGASDVDNTGNPNNTTTDDIYVIIDNFRPYIKKVEIAPNLVNNSAYIAEWQWNSTSGRLEFTKNTSFYAASPNWDLSVKVTTSEPMDVLSMQLESLPYGYSASASGTEFFFTVPASHLLQISNGGVKKLIFEGYDLADNPLMNINSTLPIPAHSINHRQDNGNWIPAIFKTTPVDDIHEINVTDVLPLAASINATSSTGNTPLSVVLSSNVSGGTPPYTYVWDFGDGKPLSTISNPIHIFEYGNLATSPNEYTVTLKVTDASGTISVVYKKISVYPTGITPSVTADFSYTVTCLSPTNFQLGLFNQSQLPNLSGIEMRWYYDYNNDQTNYGTSDVYTYTTPNTRKIRLEIFDVNNNTILGSKEKDVDISLPANPNGYVIDFTWTGCPGPVLVNTPCVLQPIFWGYFGGFPTRYVWTVTDPTGGAMVYTPSSVDLHIDFPNPTGVYTVQLEIYDDNITGGSPLLGTMTKNINVTSAMVVPVAANQVVTTTPMLINRFGRNVDLTDDYAVIGDYNGGVYPGNASVYKIDNDVLSFMCQLTGGQVAINKSGNTIVTGGGSVVSIYTRNGSQWGLTQQLGGFCMPSVDIYGDYIVVGSIYNFGDYNGNGFAQIYKKAQNGLWYYLQTINSQDNAYPYDPYFGEDVKISKSHIITSNGSSARFYEQQSNGLWGTTPVFTGYGKIDIYEDRAITSTSTLYFCDGAWNYEYQPGNANLNNVYSVAINANFALFGCGPSITGPGEVKVFQRYSNTQFYEREILQCPNPTADTRFGRACALSESHILIGAHKWNDKGAAYHYLNYISPCEKIMNISNYYPEPNNYGTRYALQIKIDNSNYNQGVDIVYKAKNTILKSGFKASLGSNVLLSFLECNKIIFSPCVNGKSAENDAIISDKENLVETEDVLLWPNPTNNIVNLKTKDPDAIIEQYELYNSLAMKIEDKKAIGKNEITIDLSGHPSGILILRAVVNSKVHFFKIIKQ